MGWGEKHEPPNGGAGTTGEIEAAHAKLDELKVPHGSLAARVLFLVSMDRIGRRRR